MAERVVIKIDVDADTKSIDRVRRKLIELKAEAEALDDDFGGLSKSSKKLQKDMDGVDKSAGKTGNTFNKVSQNSDKFNKSTGRLGNSLDKGKKKLEGMDKLLNKFGDAMQGLVKFGLKALLLNVGALSAALLSVSGAFTIGRLAVKGWHMALTGAAVVGASFISVLSAIAAGQREYNAALQAYNYKFSKGQVSGTQEAMAQMRGLTSNTKLAVLGAESLSKAFAAISQSTQVTGSITAAMQAMGDFAAASANPAKAIVAAGDFLGKLMKSGKITDDLVKSAEDVGPAFSQALANGMKNMNIKTSDQFMKALMGGQLSTGVAGQLDAVNNTLFGTFKRNLTLIKDDFADMGQGALPGFTAALERVARVISTQLISISGSIDHFTHGTLLDSLVNGFERAAKWGAKLFNEYLPKSEGTFQRISKWWSGVVDGFERAVEWMRPLLDGAQVLKDAFGPLVKSIFTEFGTGMQDFSKLLQDNRPSLMAFGDILKRVFKEIGNVFGEVKKAIITALPVLTTLGRSLEMTFQAIAKVMNGLNGMGDIGSLAAIVGGGFLYKKLGDLGEARGGSGKGGLLSRGLQAAGLSKGAMSSVANMTVMNMNVANMMGAGVLGALGGKGGGIAPLAGTQLGYDPSKPWRANLAGEKAPGRLSGLAGKAKGFLGGPVGGILSALGIGWGLGKMGENKSANWNALGGGATGAAIGTMIAPGIGTLIGAVGGVTVGGLYEAFYGRQKRNKEASKKLATEQTGAVSERAMSKLQAYDIAGAQKELADLEKRNNEIRKIVSDSIDGLSGYQRLDAVRKLKNSGKINKQEMQVLLDAPGTFANELEKQEKELKQNVIPAIDKFNTNIKTLGDVTGKSQSELTKFAQAAGVDLTAPLENFRETMSQILEIDIPASMNEMRMASQDIFLGAMDSVLKAPQALQAAGVAVDQTSSVVRDQVSSGLKLDNATASKLVEDALKFELQKTYDPLTGAMDPAKALTAAREKLGAGGSFYNDPYLLKGLEDKVAPIVAPLLESIARQYQGKDLQTKIAGTNANLIENGYNMTITPPSLAELAKMSPAEAAAITQQFQASTKLGDAATKLNNLGPQIVSAIQSGFSGMDITVNGQSQYGSPWNSDAAKGSSGGSQRAPRGKNDARVDNDKGGDTRTSRYAQTMAKHASLNSRLAGKRGITSGLRSSNLGSLGSDHLTGAAYDLTGQNLGAYQQLVKQQGGFAEFHGGTSDRHLHVVPGPSGDTPMPMAQMASAPAPASGGDTISFVVNPSPGMDETALAKKVINIYQREVRSARERR